MSSDTLSDDEVAELQARPSTELGGYRRVLLRQRERDALCATVRALRAERTQMLQSLERAQQERNRLKIGLSNIYHVITSERCDDAVALGMATSAVSSLLNQHTALREQLAQTEAALRKADEIVTEAAFKNGERVRLTEQEVKVLTDYHYYEAEKSITRLGCRESQQSHLKRLKVIQDSVKQKQP